MIGVGIIGVDPTRGWAATAHIPALRALSGYELRALSSRTLATAHAAGRAFGVEAVFDDHEELLRCPDVDLVAVTVKVPGHRELVTAALRAGKAVYCEWPLGRNLAEARELAAYAAQRDAPTVVGLQARQSPVTQYLRQLLGNGYVGEVLSTTLIGTSLPGGTVAPTSTYMLDRANGATMLSIAIGHCADLMTLVLGEFASLSAVTAVRRPDLLVAGSLEQVRKTAEDQVAVIGTLRSGVVAALHIREATAGGTGLLWEINGTRGTIRLTADTAYPEIFPMTLTGAQAGEDFAELVIPASFAQHPPELIFLAGTPAENVARTYAAHAADRAEGTSTAPDFADALRRHEVLAAIEDSAATGRRVRT